MSKNISSSTVLYTFYTGCGAAAFIALSILLFFSADELTGHYFQPKLLALVHLAVLGVITPVLFVSTYRSLPVRDFNDTLAGFTGALLFAGTAILVFAFWHFYVGIWLQAGAALVFTAVFMFAFTVFKSVHKAGSTHTSTEFLSTSVLWLTVTAALGLFLVFNFRFAFIGEEHLEYLNIHAHTGLIGWILMFLTGKGYQFAEKRFPDRALPRKTANLVYYLINSGLILLAVDKVYIQNPWITAFSALLITSGTAVFTVYGIRLFTRNGETLRLPGKYMIGGLIGLIVPVVIAVFMISKSVNGLPVPQNTPVLYGLALITGCFSLPVFGLIQNEYPASEHSKRARHNILNRGFISLIYAAAVLTIFAGAALTETILIKTGAVALLIPAAAGAGRFLSLLRR